MRTGARRGRRGARRRGAGLPESAPAWIRDGDFFGWPKQRRARAGTALSDGAELTSASSNNALVRAAAVRALDLRFDPTLALTGGEDALFFRQMKLAGCKIIYASGARVREPVSPDRATFAYLWRVHYRQGCNKVPRKLRLETKGTGLSRFVRMAAKRIPRECADIGGGVLTVASPWPAAMPTWNSSAPACYVLPRAWAASPG